MSAPWGEMTILKAVLALSGFAIAVGLSIRGILRRGVA
jgi:hypothetical protein